MTHGPAATGKEPETVTLTGAVFPWDGEKPVYLSMPGSDLLYIACFHDVADLKSVMDHFGIEYASVKRIDDEKYFIASVIDLQLAQEINLLQVAVILNARVTETGRLRFMQII